MCNSEVTLCFPMFPGLTQVHTNTQVFTMDVTRFEAQKIIFCLQKIQSAEGLWVKPGIPGNSLARVEF